MVVWYLIREWPAIVQALSALTVAVLTYFLLRATNQYATLTRASLQLATRQFEQELLPHWHISFAPSQPQEGIALLKIFNLSKNAASITQIFMRAVSENEQESRRFPLDVGMPSGHWELTPDEGHHILETVTPYLVDGNWTGTLEIGVVFLLAEGLEPRPSKKFPFRIAIRDGRFRSATPISPYIAGDLGEAK